MHPRVRLYIIDVILLLSLCALKFLITKIFIDFLSKNNNVYTTKISTILQRLNAISVNPNIIPTKIKKKISKSKPKLKLRTASGKTKYIVMPAAEPINPEIKQGNFALKLSALVTSTFQPFVLERLLFMLSLRFLFSADWIGRIELMIGITSPNIIA